MDKYSLGNQLELGIKKSKELKMDYKDWCEGGKSGFSEKIEDRDVLQELFIQLQSGIIKHLYVVDLSRLSRNPIVSSLLRQEMEKKGVSLYTNETNIDFQSDEQVLMYDFVSSMNNFFIKVQRKKSMVGKVSHFKSGGYRGGVFPFGYKSENIDGKRKLVINTDESVWVRKIFEWYDKGKSINDIGKSLDKNGMKPRRSEFWCGGSILKILKNELYLGKDTFTDNITNPKKPKILINKNKDLQIVDDVLFSKVSHKIEHGRSLRNQINKSKHNVLLRGFLFCGDCDSVWGVRINPEKYERYYYCRSRENNWRKKKKKKNCRIKKSINIPHTDKIIWETLVELLNKSNTIKEIIKQKELEIKVENKKRQQTILSGLKKKVTYVKKKLWDLEVREKEIREWYAGGEIDKTEFKSLRNVTRKKKDNRFFELEKIELDIQQITDKKIWIDWLEKHSKWIKELKEDLSIEEKQKIVKEFVYKIVVNFDSEKNLHLLQLHLELPIINDVYVSRGTQKNKKRDYEIKSGNRFINKEVEKVKIGRKKKR